MSQDNTHEMVQVGDEPVSLADLAGFDLGGIDAARFFKTPVGTYCFEIIADADNGRPELRAAGGKAMVKIPCKIIDVIAVKDKTDAPDGDPMKLLGKVHNETQFVSSAESLRYIKAMIADLCFVSDKQLKGGLSTCLDGLVGKQFQAPIAHRVNPNDRDKSYAQIVQEKIKPVTARAA